MNDIGNLGRAGSAVVYSLLGFVAWIIGSLVASLFLGRELLHPADLFSGIAFGAFFGAFHYSSRTERDRRRREQELRDQQGRPR